MSFEGYKVVSIGIIVKHTSRFCTVHFDDGFKSNYDLDVVGDGLLEDDKTRYEPKQWIAEQRQGYGTALCFGCHSHGRLDGWGKRGFNLKCQASQAKGCAE